jgi:DNA-binding response OmpR family regulator
VTKTLAVVLFGRLVPGIRGHGRETRGKGLQGARRNAEVAGQCESNGSLPIRKPIELPRAFKMSGSTLPALGNARILVVEDDDCVRAVVGKYLKKAGYRVLEAPDGKQGLELALKEKPGLIVLDFGMPVMDGLEVASELRRLGATTPILMLTVRQDVPQRVDGLMAGADDYLGKPFDGRELLARVHALLRRQTTHLQKRRVLRFDHLVVDLERRMAARGRIPVPLTQTDFALLELLAAHMDSPVSHKEMSA